MQQTASSVRYIGVVKHPCGTSVPCPRLYFDVGREVEDDETRELARTLSRVCKHVSGVWSCKRTPKGDAADLYVALGGMDADAPSCDSRIEKYLKDIRHEVEQFFDSR